MNNLRNRTSSRAVSRPNADKALDRIQAEIIALIEAAPKLYGAAQHEVEEACKDDVRVALARVRRLWL